MANLAAESGHFLLVTNKEEGRRAFAIDEGYVIVIVVSLEWSVVLWRTQVYRRTRLGHNVCCSINDLNSFDLAEEDSLRTVSHKGAILAVELESGFTEAASPHYTQEPEVGQCSSKRAGDLPQSEEKPQPSSDEG